MKETWPVAYVSVDHSKFYGAMNRISDGKDLNTLVASMVFKAPRINESQRVNQIMTPTQTPSLITLTSKIWKSVTSTIWSEIMYVSNG